MNSNSPRITVIVPTRERCDVLQASLKTVVAQNYQNLEIIVSDNFSNDLTKEVVLDTGDSRIRYINPGRRLSMSHHWEFALSHASDGWVTIVGDDDGLLPSSVSDAANIMARTKSLAIRSNPCRYRWPSLTGEAFGTMLIPLGTAVTERSCTGWLKRLMRGYAHYLDLPVLYTGTFVHTDAIKKIRQATGDFFISPIPDVYSGIAIASVIPTYAYSHYPLGIAGVSGRSTGMSISKQKACLETTKTEAQKFLSEGNISYHSAIPCVEGVPLVSNEVFVYDAYLRSEALRDARFKFDPQQQLELIVAKSNRPRAETEKWAKSFAALHNLDYEKAQRRRAVTTLAVSLNSIGTRMQLGICTSEVGSPSLPLRDVFEASIAAAAYTHRMPSRNSNIAAALGRAMKKLRVQRH